MATRRWLPPDSSPTALIESVGDSQELGRLLHRPSDVGHSVQVGGKAEVLANAQFAVERSVLGHDTHPPAQLLRQRDSFGGAEPSNRAFVGRLEPADGREQGALPGAVGSQQAEHAALLCPKRDGIEGYPPPVAPGDRVELDRPTTRTAAHHVLPLITRNPSTRHPTDGRTVQLQT